MQVLHWMERKQVTLYIVAMIAGATIGLLWPQHQSWWERLLPMAMAVLMFGMFSLIPFLELKQAWRHRRFMLTLLIANFILVPLLVWLLATVFPISGAVKLGMMFVLLAPCVDYVIVFAKLGGGNARLLLASTPMLLLVQLLVLPLYLWLFLGPDAAAMIRFTPFAEAFLMMIALPMGLAVIAQRAQTAHRQMVKHLGVTLMHLGSWLPVPMMGVVLLAVLAAQFPVILAAWKQVWPVVPLYVLFMLAVPLLTRPLVAFMGLETAAGRSVMFSAATRNSLVVLPFALALPEPLSGIAAGVIVVQTAVELCGELVYIRWIPKLLRDT